MASVLNANIPMIPGFRIPEAKKQNYYAPSELSNPKPLSPRQIEFQQGILESRAQVVASKSKPSPRPASAASQRSANWEPGSSGNERPLAPPSRPSSALSAPRPQSALSFQSSSFGSRPGSAVGRPQSAASARPQSALTHRSFIVNEKPQIATYVAKDRLVLRFYAYFVEPVPESAMESERVRKCIVYFYLEDSSVRINEPKRPNSGIPQGVYARRIAYRKENGEFFSPADFSIGKAFHLNGRRFFVVDCDVATREFYERQSITQGEPLPYPEDSYSRLNTKATVQRGPVEVISYVKKGDTLKKFMDFDRHVLRFDAYWDNTDKIYGEKRKFYIHYYLSNDTMEVAEVATPNNGRDAFPLLLKRQKLPKYGYEFQGSTEFVHFLDLRCGGWLEVYGRDFFLADCDGFTRDFYRRSHGIEQTAVAVTLNEKKPLPKNPVPPPTGFGNEEDSLVSVYSLIPKPPKKNIKWQQRNSRKILRFGAELVGARVEDAMRQFVLSFFMEDNSLSIFEPPIRNSGILGGKFLERAVYKNPTPPEGGGPRTFMCSDFFIGAIIGSQLSNQRLRITSSDEFTLKFCESNPRDFPMSSVERVASKIINSAAARSINLRERGREVLDPSRSHLCDKAAFRKFLDGELGLAGQLCEHEYLSLERRFLVPAGQAGPRGGAPAAAEGKIKLEEVCDLVSRVYAQKRKSEGERPEDGASSEGEAEERLLLTELRCNNTQVRNKLMLADERRAGGLPIDQFSSVLAYYNIVLTERELEVLQRFGAHPEPGMIAYHDVMDAVYPCDFRTSVSMRHVLSRETLRSSGADGGGDDAAAAAGRRGLTPDISSDFSFPGAGIPGLPPRKALLTSAGASAGRPPSATSRPASALASRAGGGAATAAGSPHVGWASASASGPGIPGLAFSAPFRPPSAATTTGFASLRGLPPRSSAPRPGSAASGGAGSLAGAAATPQLRESELRDRLRDVLGSKKYMLRKRFRDADASKAGLLGEDAFIGALTAVVGILEDEDMYQISADLFSRPGVEIDYLAFIDTLFE